MKINNKPKPIGHSKGSTDREVQRNIGLSKGNRKISSKQPNPTSTRTIGTRNNAQSE